MLTLLTLGWSDEAVDTEPRTGGRDLELPLDTDGGAEVKMVALSTGADSLLPSPRAALENSASFFVTLTSQLRRISSASAISRSGRMLQPEVFSFLLGRSRESNFSSVLFSN